MAVFDQEHPPPSSVWVVSSGQHQPHSDSKAKAALVKLTDSMERLRLDRRALGKGGSKKATTGALIDTLAVVGTESGMGVGKWSVQQHGRERASSGSIVYKGWPTEGLWREEGPQMIISLSQHLGLLFAHPECFSVADVHKQQVMFLGQGEALCRVCRPHRDIEAAFFLVLSMDQDILNDAIADNPRRLPQPPPPHKDDAAQAAKKPMKQHMGNRQPARRRDRPALLRSKGWPLFATLSWQTSDMPSKRSIGPETEASSGLTA